MSELEKAKQEVEQVCYAYDKSGDTGDIKDWKNFYDLENKLIEKVKIANQPSLTIPKSIADDLDDIFNGFVKERHSRSIWNLLWRAEEIEDEIGMQLEKLLPDVNQVNIAIVYLAGKAIGVDFVKVVEG